MSAQPAAADAQQPPKSDLFPPGIPYIVGNEGAERFSFYGMKAILYVYLVALYTQFVRESLVAPDQLAAANAHATEVVHLFVAGVYAFPLVGAIISDRWLGKYNVIFWVSLIYCIGHAVLAVAGRLGEMGIFRGAELGMYIGLALIAVGSGGIKPCVSANVGDQFTSENAHLVTKVFQIFYFIINFGSFFSTLLTPFLYVTFGAEIAFGVPGILMFLATIVFWMGRKKFVRVPPNPGGKLGLLDSFVTLLLLMPLLIFAFGGILPAVSDFVWNQEFSIGGLFGVLFSRFWPHLLGALACFVVGFLLFNLRQRIQRDEKSFLPVLLYNLTHQKERQPGEGFWDVGRRKFGEEAGDGPPAVLKIVVVFSMVSVFWALFDQHASTWVEQAKQMDLALVVPAWTGWWALVGTLVISIYAGFWLFFWIANKPLKGRLSTAVIGGVLALGVVAALLDVAGPAAGNRVVDVIVKTQSADELKAVTKAISDAESRGAKVRFLVADARPVSTADVVLAKRKNVPIFTLNAPTGEGVDTSPAQVQSFSSPDEIVAAIQARQTEVAEAPRPENVDVQMEAAQLSALNPLMVMLIIPALNVLVYAPLRKRGIEVKPLQKMTVGMFLAAVAFAAAAILQAAIETAGVGEIHALWQTGPYLIMTTAEVLVSITGLEFAYTQAPRAMKSTIMGFWLLCVTFGNLLAAFLAPLLEFMALSAFFWVFTATMAAAAVVFAILAYFYKGKSYLQQAAA